MPQRIGLLQRHRKAQRVVRRRGHSPDSYRHNHSLLRSGLRYWVLLDDKGEPPDAKGDAPGASLRWTPTSRYRSKPPKSPDGRARRSKRKWGAAKDITFDLSVPIEDP